MLAAAIMASALLGSRVPLNADGLRRFIEANRRAPADTSSESFSIELPVVSDHATDLGSLQNPIGWSYDKAAGVMVVSVDFGAVTPENYAEFDRQHLERAPPLRTVFFYAGLSRDPVIGRTMGGSYGLAVPTSTKAHELMGGDLPEGFSAPSVVKIRMTENQAKTTARTLRLRVEGRLRTIGGAGVLCSRNPYDGYAIRHSVVGDAVVETERSMVNINECFAPALLTRVALISTSPWGEREWHGWRRASLQATEETPQNAVTIVTDHRAPQMVLGDPTVSTLSNTPGSAMPTR